MPNNDYDDYDDEDTQDRNSPANLRQALKKAQADLKSRNKEFDDLKSQMDQLQSAQRSSSIKSILESKGVAPGLAKFLERDDVEASDEGVSKWIDENKEFFNIKPAKGQARQEQSSGEDESGEDEWNNLPPALQAAIRSQQSVNQLAEDSDSARPTDSKAEDQMAAFFAQIGKNAKSPDDITQALKTLGAPVKQGY